MLDVSETTSTNRLQKSQLIADLFQGRVPLKSSVFVGYQELGSLLAMRKAGNQLFKQEVGNHADDHTNGEREKTKNQANSPLRSVQPGNREGLSTNKDDQDLTADDDKLNPQKPSVAEHAIEDVKSVVETTRIPLVENLHPNKGVEHHRLVLSSVVQMGEVQGKSHGKLIDTLSDDHFPHCQGDQRAGLWFGFTIKNGWRRGVRS